MKSTTDTSRAIATSPVPRPSAGTGTKGEGNTAAAPPIFFPPIVTPTGDGSFVVRPGKPIVGECWITTREAMRILGYTSRSLMSTVRADPFANRFIRWKFTSPSKRKCVYEAQSVWAYRRQLENFGK